MNTTIIIMTVDIIIINIIAIITTTSVARGGGGGQGGNCLPNNAFSEFCRYIWKFVGTLYMLADKHVICTVDKVSEVPTKY